MVPAGAPAAEARVIDTERLEAQMSASRFAGGRFERLVHGEWVAWPVLPIDRLGRDEAARTIAHAPKKRGP